MLPELAADRIVLIVAPRAARDGMLDLTATLARRGPVRVLDGGNQFNAYYVARAVRRHAPNLSEILSRIDLARAFTCYQMESLLLASAAAWAPTVVLDFLSTFYDENVSLAERRRLLQRCALHLRRLSGHAPVVVSVQQAAGAGAFPAGPFRAPAGSAAGSAAGSGAPLPAALAERQSLLAILHETVDQVLEWQAPEVVSPQLPLFAEI
jgi:hypothetical protein